MTRYKIIDARDIVTPSTRPHNERMTRHYLENYYSIYGSRVHIYTSRRSSPAEISVQESELVMKLFE